MTCENYGSAMAGPGVALECPDGTHGRWHAINNVTVIDSDTKHEHSREYKLQMGHISQVLVVHGGLSPPPIVLIQSAETGR